MRTHPNFRLNLLCAAVLVAMAVPAMAQDAGQPSQSSSATNLDKITVTGSRIKRTDVEAALPVTIIQKAEIEAQGITSAEQLLQQLNVASNGPDTLAANSGIAPPGTRGNNGVSGANLRGQGADATLVLLNGRRVATHGLAGQVVDLNSIPFQAIERVEVLRDGASAVYGTDAIGGVINFITKTDYQGLSLSAGADVTQEGGGNIYNASMLGGFGDLDTDRWNVWVAATAKKNDILRGNQRDFANSFQPERGLSPDTRGTPFATVVSGTNSLIGGGLRDPASALTKTSINTLDLPGGAGCENGGDMMGPYDDKIWASPGASFACAWDYGRARTIQQPVQTLQAIGRATFKIGDNHEFFAEVMGSKVTSKRQFEAQQLTTSINASSIQLDAYELNANTKATYDAVYNALMAYFGDTASDNLVYGRPITYRWRCEICGPRQLETTTSAYRVLFGLNGTLGTWDYTVGLSRAESRAQSVLAGGYYYTPALKAALKNGVLNPFLMPGQDQSQAAYAALAAADASGLELYHGKSTMTTLDASFSGSLGFNLWAKEDVQAAVGIDMRREEYEFGGPADWARGNAYVFGPPGDAANYMTPKQRDVKAVFAEFNVPVLDSLELNLAVRHDRYDGFGGTTNPKYSFKWQPVDWLAFRGSYSTGFKVPDFAKLFRGISEIELTDQDFADPAICPNGRYNPDVPNCNNNGNGPLKPIRISGGNPNLEPEEANQKSIGFVLAPTSKINLSVDWWEIERINTIRSGFSLETMRTNYAKYAANFIRDESGKIVAIDQRFINTGGTLTRGVEIDANVGGELAGGDWNVHLNGNYLDTFKTKSFDIDPYSDNLVGMYERYFNLPIKWKHTLGLSWSKGDWAHTLTQIYRGGYKDYRPGGIVNGYTPSNWNPDVDEYITYNYSISWTGIQNLKATFGIRNLLNTDPPFTVRYLDDGDGAGWEARVADPRGRSFNMLLEYRFE